MDTVKFIKRLATILAVENTAFIVPIEDEAGNLCGWYPIRPQRCEVVEAAGQVYLRYLFANGEYGAIEFERVGIMTDFEYSDDLFGEDNTTLKPTMQLIHTQNEGIINAVKNSANIRFLAKVANMLKPEDIKKERERFTEDNLSADNKSGMIIYDNKLATIFGDIVAGIPYMIAFFRGYPQSVTLFNYTAYGYSGVVDQIMPLISYGYQYFSVFAPILTICIYNIALYFECKYRKSNIVFNKILYSLMFINLSIGPCIFGFPNTLKRLCMYIPLLILIRLNKKH